MKMLEHRINTLYKRAAIEPESKILFRLAQRLLVGVGHATWFLRPFPDFLIIGAQKAGTSSLYKYLLQHPAILPAYQKEIHFFTIPELYYKGHNWYRGHFASRIMRGRPHHRLTGEASPSYLFFPLVPERVHQIMPDVKLIVLLRDPISRAFSNYHHQVRRGLETLSFEEAIEREPERLGNDLQKTIEDPHFHSLNLAHYSYLLRGKYASQLTRWRSFFPMQQMLIIKSEDFYAQPMQTVLQVSSFLDLPAWQPNPAIFKRYNPGAYDRINPHTQLQLSHYFRPDNEELYEFLGRNLAWS